MRDALLSSDTRIALEGLPNTRVRGGGRDLPPLHPKPDPLPPPLPRTPSVERAIRAASNGHTNGTIYRTNGKGHP